MRALTLFGGLAALSLPAALVPAALFPATALADSHDTADTGDTGEEGDTDEDTDSSDDDEEDVPTFTAADAAGEDGGCAAVGAPAAAGTLGLAVLLAGLRRED